MICRRRPLGCVQVDPEYEERAEYAEIKKEIWANLSDEDSTPATGQRRERRGGGGGQIVQQQQIEDQTGQTW